MIGEMQRRINQEASPAEASELWVATYLLLGLKYDEEITNRLLSGVRAMEESATYQAIVAKSEAKGRTAGRLEEARRILFKLGTYRFGEPNEWVHTQLESLQDVERIEELTQRVLTAQSWDDLTSKMTRDPVLAHDKRESRPIGFD